MQATPTGIEGVVVFEPKVFGDARGFFLESFRQNVFDAAVGGHVEFVQDNHSRSPRGVLRGLHWQEAPHAQGKLVRVTRGAVFDVAVDIRRGSPTFGKWVGEILSESNFRQLYVPAGFLHGFCVLSETAQIEYKCTAFYSRADELSVVWNDPELAIAWPVQNPLLSAKDAAAPRLRDLLAVLPPYHPKS